MLAMLFLVSACAAPRHQVAESGVTPPAKAHGVVLPASWSARGPAAGLLAAAGKQLNAGRFEQAAASLERAIRIAPRDPLVWHAMAWTQFALGRFSKTVQFCLKADTLLTGPDPLRRANWELLAHAYQRLGQIDKAAVARQKAARR